MHRDWEKTYALQDWVLRRLKEIKHELYLTRGTALSRAYYSHRYSDDLDFFSNDSPDFSLFRDRCLEALARAASTKGMRLEIALREERFGRAFLHCDLSLKIEFINDVPFRVGSPWKHPLLGAEFRDGLESLIRALLT